MILGPREALDVYMRSGQPSVLGDEDSADLIMQAEELLHLPIPVLDQEIIMSTAPCIDAQTLDELHELGLFSDVYTAVVCADICRRHTRRLRSTVLDARLPAHSVLCMLPHVYIPSPALCILLLARMQCVSFEELVFDISELCGCYAYENVPLLERGLIERRPLVGVSDIVEFCERTRKLNYRAPRGIRRLERALGFAIERARSPFEIALGMNMALPTSRGGLQMPRFATNACIQLSEREQWALRRSYVESDFVWTEQKVIVEYCGGVNADNREEGTLRMNILQNKGYEVQLISNSILCRFDAFMGSMYRLEKCIGTRIGRSADVQQKQRWLQGTTFRLAGRGGVIASEAC